MSAVLQGADWRAAKAIAISPDHGRLGLEFGFLMR